MIFYLQYDESFSHKDINGKRIKKMVKAAFSKLPEEFSKVEMSIDKFDLYNVEISAHGITNNVNFETENSNLNSAITKCIEGIKNQFSCIV